MVRCGGANMHISAYLLPPKTILVPTTGYVNSVGLEIIVSFFPNNLVDDGTLFYCYLLHRQVPWVYMI